MRIENGMELQVCLDKLGARVRVWEAEPDRFAMAYGWLRGRGWRLKVSRFIDILLSASITIDRDLAKVCGCVLGFEEDMKLIDYRAGLLGDLNSPRHRPNDAKILKEGSAQGAR